MSVLTINNSSRDIRIESELDINLGEQSPTVYSLLTAIEQAKTGIPGLRKLAFLPIVPGLSYSYHFDEGPPPAREWNQTLTFTAPTDPEQDTGQTSAWKTSELALHRPIRDLLTELHVTKQLRLLRVIWTV